MNTTPVQWLRSVLTIALGLCCAASASAHDSWLVVDQNIVREDEMLWIAFVTGEVFPHGDQATDPDRVASCVDRHGKHAERITGLARRDRALSVRRAISGPGVHVIGCALKPRLIELPIEVFEKYLRAERAEEALRRFAGRRPSSSDEPVVEEYTKFAKTIVEVQPPQEEDDAYRTPLGHRLELIPMSNPCHWKVGQNVRVQVLLDGHPWPDVPVALGYEGADPQAEGAKPDASDDDHSHVYAQLAKTDAKGMASIQLERAGHAFLKAHFIRPTDGLGRAKWESFWASLTFRVIGKTDVSGELRSIRGVHGRLTPGAVVGYRMGLAALRQLELSPGDDALLVRHICPLETPYASIVDGIQAATGASLGRLTLWIDRTDSPADMRTVFINQRTGETLQLDCRKDWRALIANARDAFDVEALALKAATTDDDVLFGLTTTSGSGRDAHATLPSRDPASSSEPYSTPAALTRR